MILFGRDHYVHKFVYILLAVFLGSLGVHHLYGRRYLAAFVYFILCFTGISSFLAIIDAIVALVTPADPYGYIPV